MASVDTTRRGRGRPRRDPVPMQDPFNLKGIAPRKIASNSNQNEPITSSPQDMAGLPSTGTFLADRLAIDDKSEVLTKASFLSSNGKFRELPRVLISKRSPASYMYEKTLKEVLGYDPVQTDAKRGPIILDPRGAFSPIGRAPIYILFSSDGNTPELVEFYVLPGAPLQNGFLFILGKPEITKCLGQDWSPEKMGQQR